MFSSIYMFTGQPVPLSSSTSFLPSKMNMMNHCHDLFLGFFCKHIRCLLFWGSCPAEFFNWCELLLILVITLYENLHKYVSLMMCHIIWHSLGTADRTVSKSSGLHTVMQSGRASISRTSLMVNATCNGPRRPISFTWRTLLCDSVSRACSAISVLCKNHI